MNRKKIFPSLCLLLIFGQVLVFAQSKIYEGPDDPAGDISAEREGWMNGNRVLLLFQNTTELSGWPRMDASRWPYSYTGRKMNDGVGLLIGARVYITGDTIPVTDPAQIAAYAASGQLDTLYYCQTSYREKMDMNPSQTVEWAMYPVSEYLNPMSETPALSNNPASWPVIGWPARGREKKWPGEWDGRFGRGIFNAELECYVVANDAHDQEYLPANNAPVRYYPRPGVKIGDIDPDITIQRGLPWGGIGIRVEQRGFQWDNPQARDAIFWEYTIANISDYDLPEMAFGYWVDNAIGGDGAMDELAAFDKVEDLAYSWDINGVGAGGVKTGTMGFAFLESPGVPYDGTDNDDDGLVDEQRDNPATVQIGPVDGITDLDKFLSFYRLKQEDLREHWDADEDQDWDDGFDANGNGVYDEDEYSGDDVGTDGVGPHELNYYGPDENGTECNHKPDFIEGLGSEPDFAFTDISESDMLGLTSFHLFPIEDETDPNSAWFFHDEAMWHLVASRTLDEYIGEISNLIEIFASSIFPLYQGRTERISMSELHSFDPLEGLQSPDHSAPALFQLKQIVQVIYESDYRFATPPKMPTLTATPGDGYVMLTWDNIADTKTREPLLHNENDFQGYKLFRATDRKMVDPEVITDGFGNPLLKKPIFECDIKDDISGFADYGTVPSQGAAVYLGSNTGITHHYKDTNVQNGRTYYYALVAYDHGIPPDVFKGDEKRKLGIAPSQNNIIIELNEFEEITFTGINVAVVTPGPRAIGEKTVSNFELKSQNNLGSGYIEPKVASLNAIKNGHEYRVSFDMFSIKSIRNYDHGIHYTTNGLRVYDITGGGEELVYSDLMKEDEEENFYAENYHTIMVQDTAFDCFRIDVQEVKTTGVFDGLQLDLQMDVKEAEYDPKNSGWISGDSPMNITLSSAETKMLSWDYDIVFTDDDSVYMTRLLKRSVVRDENGDLVSVDELLTKVPFNFFVRNRCFTDSTTGDFEKLDIVVHDLNLNGQFDILQDRILVGPLNTLEKWAGTAFIIDFSNISSENELPQNGDVYQIRFIRPFWVDDSFSFTINAENQTDQKQIADLMKDIEVVPNPYIATNLMEEAVANTDLNQRRRILFTNLPAKCTVKIFTSSGILVDELKAPENALVGFNGLGDASNGILHWDLKTREGLDIAAGMYLYHVRDETTGNEKMGKFAVIK